MRIYIQSIDYSLWKIITIGPKIPMKTVGETSVVKTEDEWNDAYMRNIKSNSKAMNILYCALDSAEYNRISICETAKEIWDKLIATHEGNSQVKESKIDILVHNYELFKMKPGESISDMFTRFTDIVNGLKSLGKSYTNSEMARKILRSMAKSWDSKASIILQTMDFSKCTMDELMGSLMTEEIHRKLNEEVDTKRKDIALKSTTSKSKNTEEASEESDDDEEMALITKNSRNFSRKRMDGKEGNFSKRMRTKKMKANVMR